MTEFKPEPNYSPIEESLLNIIPSSNGSILKGGSIQSINYSQGISGWKLNSDGTMEINAPTASQPSLNINQKNLTETNFKKIITEKTTGISVWISDGTSPDANLTGVVGDLCLNGPNGVSYYCDTAGKNWTALA